MPGVSRRFLVGLSLLLAAGAGIGWLYGDIERGLLIAALAALFWEVRHLLSFVNAIRTQDFAVFREGDGVWQQIYSDYKYQRDRADRHKRKYRKLLREARKSTDAMPDGAVILDANNEIIMCNRAAKKLAGLKPKKDRGQRVDNILRVPELTTLIRAEDYESEIEIPSPVRDDGWLNCRVVPYGADQKLLFLRDVSDRIRLTRMRRDFVANASHELRSPLTVVSGYLDSLAEDDAIPADWQAPIAQMQIQARRMNHIVGEFLELSRLESERPTDDEHLVDVGRILNSAKKSLYQQGSTPEIAVHIDSPVRLKGNSNEIESLVTNLLSNAVRHTPPDGQITMRWRSDEAGAELVVSDTGEGIDPTHIPRLTERFFRVDRGRSRTDGGVGLGLAIVKHVLSRHDAELRIDSQPGRGSRFSCYFPTGRIAIETPVALTELPRGA